jgi:hypothetical protein
MSTCQVEINDALLDQNIARINTDRLNFDVNKGLALLKYIQCEISIGKLSDILGLGVIETKEWIDKIGLTQAFDEKEVEQKQKTHVDHLMKMLDDKE